MIMRNRKVNTDTRDVLRTETDLIETGHGDLDAGG